MHTINTAYLLYVNIIKYENITKTTNERRARRYCSTIYRPRNKKKYHIVGSAPIKNYGTYNISVCVQYPDYLILKRWMRCWKLIMTVWTFYKNYSECFYIKEILNALSKSYEYNEKYITDYCFGYTYNLWFLHVKQ